MVGEDAESPSDGVNVFGEHYSAETRAALPLFAATDTAPVVEMLRDAGFNGIQARGLPQFTFEGLAPYLIVAKV